MRVNVVKKAQKAQGSCGVCHEEVKVGDGYRWIKSRYGPKRVRHLTCAPFRASDMTSSDKLSRLYAARENVEDFLGAREFESVDDVRLMLEEAASEAREVGDEYRQSADNIESGFGSRTSMCDEIEEKADSCDNWADSLESAMDYVDEWDEEEVKAEVLDNSTGDDGATDIDTFDTMMAEKRDEWRDTVADAADNALNELEL